MPLIKEVIQSYQGDTLEEQVMREYFEVIEEMGKVQNELSAQLIEQRIMISNYEDISIPILMALERYNQTYVLKKIEEESIRAKVSKRVEEFINPSEKAILGGVSSQISDWLIASIQGEEDNYRNKFRTVVFVEKGALMRVTCMVYVRKPHSEILKNHHESVVSIFAYKMLVNANRLCYQNFEYLYEKLLNYSVGSNSDIIKKRLIEAEQVYRMALRERPGY